MRRIAQLAIVSGIVIILTGCVSQNVSKISAPVDAVCKTIVATPDVTVGKRINGEALLLKILWFIKIGSTKYADGVAFNSSVSKQSTTMELVLGSLTGDEFRDVKAAAAYDACVSNEADIIISPTYVLDVTDYFVFKLTKCNVSGFKGTINGIKSIEYKDYRDLTPVIVQQPQTRSSSAVAPAVTPQPVQTTQTRIAAPAVPATPKPAKTRTAVPVVKEDKKDEVDQSPETDIP